MEAIDTLVENTAVFVGICLSMIGASRLLMAYAGWQTRANLISAVGWFAFATVYFLVQWGRPWFTPTYFRIGPTILIVTEFYAILCWYDSFKNIIKAKLSNGKNNVKSLQYDR